MSIENRAGARGTIDADYVAMSRADGYTLYFVAPELVVLPAVRINLPFKSNEFAYLIRPFTMRHSPYQVWPEMRRPPF